MFLQSKCCNENNTRTYIYIYIHTEIRYIHAFVVIPYSLYMRRKVITHKSQAHTHTYVYVCYIFAALSRIRIDRKAVSFFLSFSLSLSLSLAPSSTCSVWPCLVNYSICPIYRTDSCNTRYGFAWQQLIDTRRPWPKCTPKPRCGSLSVKDLGDRWKVRRKLLENEWRFQMFQRVGPPVANTSAVSVL